MPLRAAEASLTDTPTATNVPPDTPATHHGHFLPGNPMPYLAPSATHQPELLLLTCMLRTIASLVEDLQHHPLIHDPLPPMSSFTNTPAYRLYLQLRNSLRHLINTTYDAQRGLNILQFLPGSPGSPGHYRMDPMAVLQPGQTNYLSSMTAPNTSPHPPTTDNNSTQPAPLVRQLHHRNRSRSRDRLPLTTAANPHYSAQPRQPLANISNATTGHRGALHNALWTASIHQQPGGAPSGSSTTHN